MEEMNRTQKLRRALKPHLQRYLRSQRVESRRTQGFFRCPVCGGDQAMLSAPGEWYCMDCKAGGDVVDYARQQGGWGSEEETVAELTRRLGVKVTQLDFVSAKELMAMEFPKRPELVRGLLTPGLFILAGPSKVGKSWMVLDLANRVSLGLPFLGRETAACGVLYISLEDTLPRLRERLSLVAGDRPGEVCFATGAELLGKGFEEQLENFLTARTGTGLVIIDTLQRIRQLRSDQYSYAADYEVMNRLKDLADRHGATVLVVHHTRKMGATDAFDTISGTTGLMGSADGAFVLRRDSRLNGAATLNITGREVEDQELRLSFEKSTMTWTLMPETAAQEDSKHREQTRLCQALRTLVDQRGSFQGSPTQLAEVLNEMLPRLNCHPISISRLLNSMESELRLDYGLDFTITRSNKSRMLCLRSVSEDDGPSAGRDSSDTILNTLVSGEPVTLSPTETTLQNAGDSSDTILNTLVSGEPVTLSPALEQAKSPQGETPAGWEDWEDGMEPDERAYMGGEDWPDDPDDLDYSGWEDRGDYESYWDSLLME